MGLQHGGKGTWGANAAQASGDLGYTDGVKLRLTRARFLQVAFATWTSGSGG